MAIAGIPFKTKTPQLICFVLLKYLDSISYEKIFNYLHLNFNFKPNIIHTDYEKALKETINKNIYFKDNIIHSKCFFHLSQMIMKKLKPTKLCNKKLNKKAIEILRNLEILCFIKKSQIKINIRKKIESDNKLKPFLNYLNNFLFKLDDNQFNYEDLINYHNKENKIYDNLKLRLHFTQNIIESLNGKINYYYPKRSTNNVTFINSISKIIMNSILKKDNIIRHDYVIRSLILLIDKLNLNIWRKKYHKIIINEYETNINNDEAENIIKIINYLESDSTEHLDDENKNNEENNKININNNVSYDSDGEKYEENELNNIFKDLSISKDNQEKEK